MTNPSETDSRHAMAVLEDGIRRCRDLLKQVRPSETDLRDALCYLKYAYSDAEYALTGVEKPEWHVLRSGAIDMVAQLLAPLKAFNPELNNWEKSRDPGIPVEGSRLRSGGKRPFDPRQVRAVYEEERKRIREELPPRQPPRAERGGSGGGRPAPPRQENSVGSGANTPPGRPRSPPPRVPEGSGATEDRHRYPLTPPPVDGARYPPPPLPDGGERSDRVGPPGGRFRLPTSEEEGTYDEYDGRERRRDRRSNRNRRRYGHQDDDLDFFRGAFQEEITALQNLDLGDDFRYPSDRAFAMYFPEFDFIKAMRSHSLRKWDGSIRDYPNFKHTYYRMVFVQREHYMHKILALEQMVPEDVKKELFHGLHNTVSDLGQRLRRLEDRYGGQERQLKQIVGDLQKLTNKGKVPYTDLRRAVEDVSAYLERPSTLPGAGETLVVLLKKVVPKHLRTQFSDAMHQWNRPRTGNNFVAYIKRRLNYEMDESDDFDKKEKLGDKHEEENKEKKVSQRTLGKMYKTTGGASCRSEESENNLGSSSGEEGDCRLTGESARLPRSLPTCKCCEVGQHHLHSCRKFFMTFSLKERVAFTKQHNVCYKCLRYDHNISDCIFRNKPDCHFCRSAQHHYLLCPGPEEGVVETVEGYGLENIGELIARKNISTMQLVANIEGKNGRLIPVNILPDTGASHNILDRKVAERAGLGGFQCKYRVTAHGGHVTEHEALCGELTLVNPK